MADFTIINGGSILILNPHSIPAIEWTEEHIFTGDDEHDASIVTWGSHGGVVVEPRYIEAIVEGIRADGLTVEAE